MSVNMLLALLAPLCILCAVFPHGWPIISCTNSLRFESWATDVAPAYPFLEFCHDARALLTTYTYHDRVSEPMSEQLSIDQGVLAQIFLAFVGSNENVPSAK